MDYFDILLAKKLNGGGGSPIDLQTLTVTENGEQDAPSGVAYNKVITNVPAPSNALFKQTLTGLPSPIATFTGADAPIDSLKASIVGVQDLHGYDGTWPAGGGTNLLLPYARSATSRGVTYTVDSDGKITLRGTATGTDGFTVWPSDSGMTITETATYAVSLYGAINATLNVTTINLTAGSVPSGIAINVQSGTTYNESFYIQIEKGSTATSYAPYSNICPISGWSGANVVRVGKNWLSTNFTSGKGINSSGAVVDNASRSATVEAIRAIPNTTYTVSYTGNERWGSVAYDKNGDKIDSATWLYSGDNFTTPLGTYYVRFIYASETAPTNVQLELGETSTTYEPYNGTNVLISFGQDVYGGVLNVSTGELTVTDAYIASYDGETLPSTWISDRDVYASGTTPTTGAEVVYKLATPQTIQLTPTQVRTLLGNNNVFADCGEVMELKYYSETP